MAIIGTWHDFVAEGAFSGKCCKMAVLTPISFLQLAPLVATHYHKVKWFERELSSKAQFLTIFGQYRTKNSTE